MRRTSVQKSFFDSPLIKKFVIHSIFICSICLVALFGRYMFNIDGFLGKVFVFIVKLYKFPAYYLVDTLGGKVTGLRLFFYLIVDMAIISIVTFYIRVFLSGELKQEIEAYRRDD